MSINNHLTRQIEFSLQIKRIRYLNLVIIVSTVLVYIAGVYTGGKINPANLESDLLPTFSVVACLILCITSIWTKKTVLKKLSEKSFLKSYFTIHLVAYTLCDIGGIIGIVSNTFFSFNLFYSTLAMVITVITMVINLPHETDFIFTQ